MVSRTGQGEFVAWVRAELERRSISQRLVARKAGIDHASLSRLMVDDGRELRLSTAIALARALGGRLAIRETHTCPATNPMNLRRVDGGHGKALDREGPVEGSGRPAGFRVRGRQR